MFSPVFSSLPKILVLNWTFYRVWHWEKPSLDTSGKTRRCAPNPSAGHTPLLWDPSPASLQTVLAAVLSRLLGMNVCLLAEIFWGLYLQNYCVVQDSNMFWATSFLWAKRRERQKKAHFLWQIFLWAFASLASFTWTFIPVYAAWHECLALIWGQTAP